MTRVHAHAHAPVRRIALRTPSARLRVVSAPAARAPRQDCTSCQHIRNCWQPGIEERVIVLNLLVCRMKRGLRRDASTKLFLELIRPKLLKMARAAVMDTSVEIDVALHDFESQAVQYVFEHYEIGEIAYPLHYLFGYPNGVLRRFAHAYREKIQRSQRENLSISPDGGLDMDSRLAFMNSVATSGRVHAPPPAAVIQPTHDEELDDQKVTARMNVARAVIADGHTLSVEEYRILRFCLTNAKDGGFKRPLNGLHVFLAKVMNIPRAKVTKIWADASAHLVHAVTESRP